MIGRLLLAWAEKRGYYTRKSGRPDTYRAGRVCVCVCYWLYLVLANDILRLAADGRICLYYRPPGYHSNKGA